MVFLLGMSPRRCSPKEGDYFLNAPDQVAWAAEAGARGMTVCHYGAVLENQFEWVHQALRNARRISST